MPSNLIKDQKKERKKKNDSAFGTEPSNGKPVYLSSHGSLFYFRAEFIKSNRGYFGGNDEYELVRRFLLFRTGEELLGGVCNAAFLRNQVSGGRTEYWRKEKKRQRIDAEC